MWILLLVLAHIFYAAVFILDKYILAKPMPNPIVYSFWVGALGIFVLILIPISFFIPNNAFVAPNGSEIFWSIIAGIAQIWAMVAFYKALNKSEVTRLIPFVGGLSSVFILILNSITIHEFLTTNQLVAFVLLVLGSLIVSVKKNDFFGKGVFRLAVLASFFFAAFWVITKYLFLGTNFISGLVWVRVGVALVAFALLLFKKNRAVILTKTHEAKPKTTGFFMLGRVLNMVGSLFLYLAVFLGSVVLANALQGLQYVFILILALILFKKIPNLKEHFNRELLLQKIVAVLMICLGLAILVI